MHGQIVALHRWPSTPAGMPSLCNRPAGAECLIVGVVMQESEVALFEVRAERLSRESSRWAWAIYRTGADQPSRKSQAMFASDAEAIEAGAQVIDDLRRRASRSSFVRPGL